MYKSPIELIYQGVEMKIEKGILKAVHKQDIIVDRDELIRALEYDRGQYEKGYADAMDSIVRCKDCRHSKLPAVLTQKYGEPGTLTCHNWHSPCNKRNVNQNDFCSYGERRTEDQ